MIWWALVCLAIFLIGVTKSGFGAGVGLMIVPMTVIGLKHLIPNGEAQALGLLLPLLILGDLLAVWQYRHLFSLQIVKHLLPGSIVGLVVGGALLYVMHNSKSEKVTSGLILTEIGIESIALVSLHWWRQWRGIQKHLMPEPLRSHVTGAFAAASSTLAHAAGPIVAMYLLPLKLDRKLFVGTCAIYFFILNTGKIAIYTPIGMLGYSGLGYSMRFVPMVIGGALFGLWVNKRMSDKLFIKIVYAITFCLGWYIIFEGVGTIRKAMQ